VKLPAIVNMLASFTLMRICEGIAHTYAIRKCHPPRSHHDVFLACRVCSGLIFRSSFVCAGRTNHQLTTTPLYCALLLMFAVPQVGRRCVSQQPSCLAFVDLSNPRVCMLSSPIRIQALPEFRYCVPRSCSRGSGVNMSTRQHVPTSTSSPGLVLTT
jgi:hypothetical protein